MASPACEVLNRPAGISAICARWGIAELSVFGSAARGDLGPGSDIDLLVRFLPTAEWDLLDILHLKDEFKALLGRPVDLVEREAIEASGNWIVAREVLGSAPQPLHPRL